MAAIGKQSKQDRHWIFGYGSLMWNPVFEYESRCMAELRGYRRSLCVKSIHHRGSPERPGLVLGLDRGGMCTGIAFEVSAEKARATMAYLRAREQVTDVYREIMQPVRLLDGSGRQVRTTLYVVNREHPQYSGRLPFERQLRMIFAGVGNSGNNIDYVINTARHLEECGIVDRDIDRLACRLKWRRL